MILQTVCKRDGHAMTPTGCTDRMDDGSLIEQRYCPKCGYREWTRLALAYEVCDQTRYSGIKGRMVA